jgi:hypothetical protein
LKAEVEKGFMGSAFHHEWIDPKPDRKRVGRRQSGRKVHFRLSPRVKGKQVNIPVSGLGFIAVLAGEDKDLVGKSQVKHDGIQGLIEKIEDTPADDPSFDATVAVLAEQAGRLMKQEEDELFPRLRHSRLDLLGTGERMAARKTEPAFRRDVSPDCACLFGVAPDGGCPVSPPNTFVPGTRLCGPLRHVAVPGSYPASRSAEPGLSSMRSPAQRCVSGDLVFVAGLAHRRGGPALSLSCFSRPLREALGGRRAC